MAYTETRAYLDKEIMPAMFDALRNLDAARPADPLNFLANEFESHSIAGMHNAKPKDPARLDLQVDMFGFTNGVVREALMQAVKDVTAARPRHPLKAIAEALRRQPAWSATAGSAAARPTSSLSQRAAPRAPAAPAPEPEDARSMLFDALDADGDGVVTKEELFSALSRPTASTTSLSSSRAEPPPSPQLAAPSPKIVDAAVPSRSPARASSLAASPARVRALRPARR